MEAIKILFNELRRCDILSNYKSYFSYNGITLEESSVAYQKRLQHLYEDALLEVPYLSAETKLGFTYVIDRYSESQDNFYVPYDSILRSMNRKIEFGNVDINLAKEHNFLNMIDKCISYQRYYLEKFAAAVGYNLVATIDDGKVDSANKLQCVSSIDDNLIKGVKGLASFLGCGITTAQNIINSKTFEMGGAQYRVGKGWFFRKDKLITLLNKDPEILKYICNKYKV